MAFRLQNCPNSSKKCQKVPKLSKKCPIRPKTAHLVLNVSKTVQKQPRTAKYGNRPLCLIALLYQQKNKIMKHTHLRSFCSESELRASSKQKNIQLTNVAWQFAKCCLWSEQNFSHEEMEKVMDTLSQYFEQANNNKPSFIAFVERILLMQSYQHNIGHPNLPQPSLWFNPFYDKGFSATFTWLYTIKNERKLNRNYLRHYQKLAQGLFHFALKPMPQIFNACRKQLLKCKAHNLLHLFYATIHHLQFKIQ